MKKILLMFFLFGTASAETSSLTWMKIKAVNRQDRTLIARSGVAIEAVRDDFVVAIGTAEQAQHWSQLGLLEVSFPLNDKKDFPPADESYHSYPELIAELHQMQRNFPDLVRLFTIGQSREGRNIIGFRICSEDRTCEEKPAVIFLGGHHSREHLAVEAPLRIFQNLLQKYKEGDERVVRLFHSREIDVIPAVNPDGLEYDIESGSYRYWRKNRSRNSDGSVGTDLNRNYGYAWGTDGAPPDGSSEVYRGPEAFSEPETQAVRDFIAHHTHISELLTFHTYSQLILYPWSYSENPISVSQDLLVHQKMAAEMSQWNGYEAQQSSEMYISSGDTADWSYGTFGIISFTFELDPSRRDSLNGFYPGPDLIPLVVEKNLEPVLYLLEYADNPYRVLSPWSWRSKLSGP